VAQYRDEIKRIWETSGHPLRELWDWAKEPKDAEKRAERFDALAEWAGSHKRQADHDSESFKEWAKKQRVYRKRAKVNRNQSTDEDVPGIESGGWHPDAKRVGVVSGIGTLTKPVAGVIHTTEGFGVPTYSGSNPHFTLDPASGALYQHQSVFQGARALKNLSGGVETNIKCIQIENIAFAARAGAWTEEMYDNLGDLMRWIEKHCGVQRKFPLPLAPYPGSPQKFSASSWNQLNSWCGHQNVPENDHGDPGALSTAKLLA
jgi:hypothetical protein